MTDVSNVTIKAAHNSILNALARLHVCVCACMCVVNEPQKLRYLDIKRCTSYQYLQQQDQHIAMNLTIHMHRLSISVVINNNQCNPYNRLCRHEKHILR